MIRISTANAFDTGISTLQKRQADLNDAQQQLTSGKRISRLSDDPVAAARAERARAVQARSDADQRAIDASRAAVAQVESAFGDAGDLVQQARELLVAAGNTSYGPAERQGLAQQLSAVRSQLLQVANRGDGAGGFLFSGQGVASPPFVDAPGGVTDVATSGTTQTASSEPLPLAADGRAAFLQARSGNGVFVTAAGSVAGSAWVDAGGVTNPSQLTGLPYSVQFTAGGAGT
ncbi:MAG TPA: flagellar hook-associated protein FlgL, partial [Burkholderiaceae bacterium]